MLSITLFVVALSCFILPQMSTAEEKTDHAGVVAAANEFYGALNTIFTGDVQAMTEVWSHADDITYMGPMGGLVIGWDKVLLMWHEQAALKLGGKVLPEQMQVNAGQDMAITSNYEIGENTNAAGKPERVSIRATNVFRKEGGKWKMIGHHTDLLPYLAKEND